MKTFEEKLTIARRLSRKTKITEISITNNSLTLRVSDPVFYHSIKGVKHLDYICKNGVIFICKNR